jgi:hypothetical protein
VGQVGPALVESANRLYPCAWTRDGRRLVYQERGAASGWDLFALAVDAEGKAEGAPLPVVPSPGNEENGAPSPDGEWLAFDSDEVDGVAQVYVAPFRRLGDKVRVTTGGGRDARWSTAGDLYYWHTEAFEVRRLSGRPVGGRWIGGLERALLKQVRPSDSARPNPRLVSAPEATTSYELDPVNERALVLATEGTSRAATPLRMVVALGWHEELKSRLSSLP